MSILNDFRCPECGLVEEVWSHDEPECSYCGSESEKIFTQLHTDIWGGPQYVTSLDQTFDSKSDLKSWLSANDMVQSPTAEKHGGAYLRDGAPRTSRIYHDTAAISSKGKGTDKRLSAGKNH